MLFESVVQRLLALLPGAPIKEVLDAMWDQVRGILTEAVREFSRAPGPESLLEFEEEVGHLLGMVASGVVACGITLVHTSPALVEQAVRLSKDHSDQLFRHVGSRVTPIRFIGGLCVELETPYLGPNYRERPGPRRGRGRRGPAGTGCYPVLAQLGLFEGATPALQSEVARQAARNTSFEVARGALAERGCDLDIKQVRRIALGVGQAALDQRALRLLAADAGERFTNDLAGKRVVIGADGGRLRTRVGGDRGRRKPNGRRGYSTPWREPRMITIYTLDPAGRAEAGSIVYEATLADADATFGLLLAELKLRGAQDAAELIIVGDGAHWIWNRTQALIEALGLTPDQITRVLDFYPACNHLSAVAQAVGGWNDGQRSGWFRRQRKALYEGKIDQVLDTVARLRRGRRGKVIGAELAYLTQYRDNMRYDVYRARAIPCGSGATESAIRCVVNQRLKGTGTFWREANAERMLHLRAYLKARRWNELILRVIHRTPDGRPDGVLQPVPAASAA
jgi:hypothetical protein